MASADYDVVILGGGIVGLSVAMRMSQLCPGRGIAVVDKEKELATHQSGHNSGVIHSGIYYRPDSRKAEFCVTGGKLLTRFCDENGIPYERCGKIILATREEELPRLEELHRRGLANGVEGLEMLGPGELREIEPNVEGVRSLHSPNTGIIDFVQVARTYADKFRQAGGDILTDTRVLGIDRVGERLRLRTNRSPIQARHLINCAGLHADRVARMMGVSPGVKIVPFRGEYYKLRPESKHKVKGLIYPVPDPAMPFLGVHFTRTIHGVVEAGPNAVLATAREGYTKTKFNPGDTWDTFSYPGFWRMTSRFWKVGIGEMHRSYVKSVFVRDLQRLIPSIQASDVEPGGSGVRAQAVDGKGRLLDDFHIEESGGAVHVLNAPSPGATASLAIGNHVAGLAAKSFGFIS